MALHDPRGSQLLPLCNLDWSLLQQRTKRRHLVVLRRPRRRHLLQHLCLHGRLSPAALVLARRLPATREYQNRPIGHCMMKRKSAQEPNSIHTRRAAKLSQHLPGLDCRKGVTAAATHDVPATPHVLRGIVACFAEFSSSPLVFQHLVPAHTTTYGSQHKNKGKEDRGEGEQVHFAVGSAVGKGKERLGTYTAATTHASGLPQHITCKQLGKVWSCPSQPSFCPT